MTRKNITVEALKAKGYKEYKFRDHGMETAVKLIKEGWYCELVPSYTGVMVAKVGTCKGDIFATPYFYREMTEEEKVKYAKEMADEKAKMDKVHAKTEARNLAKLRRYHH